MKLALEMGVSAGFHGMKQEKIVDKIVAAAPSTLSEEERTASCRFIGEMTLSCSTQCIGYRNLAE